MTRKKIYREISVNADYVSFMNLVAEVEEIAKEYQVDIKDIDIITSCDSGCEISFKSLETDQEYNARIKIEEQYATNKKARELAELARLKRKYE